jgi:transposase
MSEQYCGWRTSRACLFVRSRTGCRRARHRFPRILLRAREAGLSWPLPAIYESDTALERALFRRVGRPPRDASEPNWRFVAQELKRKGVTLSLLWQEYRAAHPEGYGYTWFCQRFAAHRLRANPSFRNRHEAGAAMQTDYAGPTVEVIDPKTGVIHQAQIFVAVLGASSLTFAMASFSQRLPDWIEGQVRALSYFGGVPKAIVNDYVPGHVIRLLCPERFCAPHRVDPTNLGDRGHIMIKGWRAIREVLARSARLVFGAVPPKKSKAPDRPQAPPASS